MTTTSIETLDYCEGAYLYMAAMKSNDGFDLRAMIRFVHIYEDHMKK
jgi:hypothetical protein